VGLTRAFGVSFRFWLVGMWGVAAGDHEGEPRPHWPWALWLNTVTSLVVGLECRFDLHGWSTSEMNAQVSEPTPRTTASAATRQYPTAPANHRPHQQLPPDFQLLMMSIRPGGLRALTNGPAPLHHKRTGPFVVIKRGHPRLRSYRGPYQPSTSPKGSPRAVGLLARE
jgi:hypothetical protein